MPVFSEIEQAVSKKSKKNTELYAAGFISYEAAPAFDPALCVKELTDFPLAWFGLYQKPAKLINPFQEIPQFISPSTHLPNGPKMALGLTSPDQSCQINWQSSVSEQEYIDSVKKIKLHIQKGDIYQMNYTFPFLGHFLDDIHIPYPYEKAYWDIFKFIYDHQAGNFAAAIYLEDFLIYSASPELFFQKSGDCIISRPMKGTAARGLWYEQDQEQMKQLQVSEKERAENIMITDMVRNDMGKIAIKGSVTVAELCKIEKYPKQWQMTTQVECSSQATFSNIFQALFPAASITGAPKNMAMQIIARREKTTRKVYTGSIGFLTPSNEMQFNVAIRTALIDRKKHIVEYGTGSGIVWDSVTHQEFTECFNKTSVLPYSLSNHLKKESSFSLLETILWEPKKNSFFLLEEHLKRLERSANYFSFFVDIRLVQHKLNKLSDQLKHENKKRREPQRVRLFVSQEGKITIETKALNDILKTLEIQGTPETPKIKHLCFALKPVSSQEKMLYHKTTDRSLYEVMLSDIPEYFKCDDVILWNENEEVTESTRANIVIQIDNTLYTPPVKCGLLPGVYRSYLIKKNQIKEKVIYKSELIELIHKSSQNKLYLINSVRKMWEVSLRV